MIYWEWEPFRQAFGDPEVTVLVSDWVPTTTLHLEDYRLSLTLITRERWSDEVMIEAKLRSNENYSATPDLQITAPRKDPRYIIEAISLFIERNTVETI